MLIPTWTASSESGMSPTALDEPSKKPTGPEFGLGAETKSGCNGGTMGYSPFLGRLFHIFPVIFVKRWKWASSK